MYLPINPILQKKLVLVRQLYQTASIQASSRYSPVSRITAVISFDLAVETMLKAIVSALDSKEQPDKTFEAVLQQANDKLEKAGFASLTDEANIRYVHSIRNDAQHKAKYPTESDIVDCRIYVRDFLQKTTDSLWGISFDNISLVDLVQNQRAKDFLTKAEKALGRGDYAETVKLSDTALTWVTWHVRQRLFGGRTDLQEGFDFRHHGETVTEDLADALDSAFEPVRGEIASELDSLREALLAIAVGMNYAQFVRLRMIVSDQVAGFKENGEPYYQTFLFKQRINEDDAQFAFNYCVDAIIQIEAQVGDIQAQQTPRWDF